MLFENKNVFDSVVFEFYQIVFEYAVSAGGTYEKCCRRYRIWRRGLVAGTSCGGV